MLVFIVNQIIERMGVSILFLYSYLDDLLAVPITLGIYHIFISHIRNNSNYFLSPSIIIICVIGFIFHFEILMPSLSNKYIADIWDPVMYILGGVFYALILNQNLLFKLRFRLEKG